MFLVKKGFACYLLKLVRNFLHKCVVSSCFNVNFSTSLEEYKGIHPPSRSIFVIIEKSYFAKVATRSKRPYTLVDLPCQVLFTLGSKRAYTLLTPRFSSLRVKSRHAIFTGILRLSQSLALVLSQRFVPIKGKYMIGTRLFCSELELVCFSLHFERDVYI
jgi:hypothetical protein